MSRADPIGEPADHVKAHQCANAGRHVDPGEVFVFSANVQRHIGADERDNDEGAADHRDRKATAHNWRGFSITSFSECLASAALFPSR